MAENNRDQNNPGTPNRQSNLRKGDSEQKENTSSQNEEQNPQEGKEWSNYQTRELSSNPKSGKKIRDSENNW